MRHLLVDKILSWSPQQRIRGVKAVSFEEYSIRQPLGYEPALPESLAAGAILELGNWLTILSSDYTQLAWVLEIEQCTLTHSPGPGDHMLIEVQMHQEDHEHVSFTGTASIGGHEAIRIDNWRCQMLPLHEHCDADDLRALYGQIGEGGA